MTHDIAPFFLFSLPRSGSTLCQRLLGTDPRVATASETWILLPPLYALRREGVFAEYWHSSTVDAIEDFCETLPNGTDTYRQEVRALALRLYAQSASQRTPDARYFLEKTPRYSLIAEDIFQTFPDGKFLFLWRNPLAVIASIIQTWGRGMWHIPSMSIDLYAGLERLTTAYEAHKDISMSLRFEDMIADPQAECARIFAYLGLPYDPGIVARFPQTSLEGRMGDPTRQHYAGLSHEPLEKWMSVLANPFRKRWCRRYLEWIGADRLALMGYDHSTLQANLSALPNHPGKVPSDLFWSATWAAYNALGRIRPSGRRLFRSSHAYALR